MSGLIFDEKGFVCECGLQNDYPPYVSEHREVRLIYTCSCNRKFILYKGKVRQVGRQVRNSSESDSFGD